MRRVAINAAVVFAVLAVCLVLWQLRSVVLLFIVSLGIAGAVRRPIDLLQERRVPRWLAIGLAYLLVIGVPVAVFWAISVPLISEWGRVLENGAAAYERLQQSRLSGRLQLLAGNLPAPEEVTGLLTSEEATVFAEGVLSAAQSIFGVLGQLVLALAVSVYWTADRVRFERLWLSLLPAEGRARARNAWRVIESDVGAYVRVKLLQSLVVGGLVLLGLQLLGVQTPFTWSLLLALAWFVPRIGGLALLPLVAVVLNNAGGEIAAATALYVLLVYALAYFVIKRRMRAPEYSSVLALLLMIALTDSLGLIGLLVAPIVAVAVQTGLREWLAATFLTHAESRISVDELHAQLDDVRALVSDMEEPAARRLQSLASRLATLVEKTEQVPQAQSPQR